MDNPAFTERADSTIQFDPNEKIQEAMTNLWLVVVEDSEKAKEAYLQDILADLIPSVGSRLVFSPSILWLCPSPLPPPAPPLPTMLQPIAIANC